MSFFYAIILGIIQGITEFFPVSSFGHSGFLIRVFGISDSSDALLSTFLHIGTLAALFFIMQKEIRSIIRESFRFLQDLMINFLIYCSNRQREHKRPYTKLIGSKSRKLAVMVIVGTIPTFVLGFSARHLVSIWSLSSVWPSIGFLITGIILLVAHFSNARGKKGIAEASLDQSMWIGIAQGLSVFPGISRCGLTLSGGLFFGYSRAFAIRYSYLLSIPAIIGSFFYEIIGIPSAEITMGIIFNCLIGMIFAAITSVFCIRTTMKLMKHLQLWILSCYCFAIGVFTLFYNLH